MIEQFKQTEEYKSIKPRPRQGVSFMHFPRAYCENCFTTFALYSFSIFQPSKTDENGIPYYTECEECRIK